MQGNVYQFEMGMVDFTQPKGWAMELQSQIQRMLPNKILEERDQLALKLVCLKKILDGQTVPQNVNDCRIHRGQKKNWNYQPAGSSNTYIYFPIHLIP